MKKFYIPTSSLNFNNILSTESVSPKAFYECRKFGYGRWTSIPENSCDFAVTLYDHPGMFIRELSDLEDHPLLIEYSTDEEFKKVEDGTYISDHTLYLNPAITRFIFFTEQDKKVALSLTESSLETKLVSVYGQRIFVETFEKRYVPVGVHEPNNVNEAEVEKDRLINRLKGLLYGYYVGASVAASPEQVKKVGTYLQIQNIFAAIASSASRMPTDAQREQLKQAFAVLDRFDPLYNALLDFEREASRVDQLLAILRKFGKDLSPNDAEALVASLKSEVVGECYGVRWVKEKIQHVQAEMAGTRVYLAPEKDEILVIDGKLAKISNEYISDKQLQKLFIAWVNEVLVRPDFNGKLSSCKEGLADALTFKAKDVIGSEWVDGNPVRRYLNAMRKHIIGKNEFNEEWKNGLLSSMAAVLSKGDDWDGLLRFMQSKGLTDYRLAFAIYGELNGFANLTRDFTDIVLGGRNKERRAMYQEFYGQLHGLQIDWSQLDNQLEKTQTVENLKTKVLRFFDGPDFKIRVTKKDAGKKAHLRELLINVFDKIGYNPLTRVFIDVLGTLKDGWNPDNQPWKQMRDRFAPDFLPPKKSGARKKSNQSQRTERDFLPGLQEKYDSVMPSGASILSFNDWIDECLPLIGSAESRSCFQKDVEYFIERWEIHPDVRYADKARDKSNSAILQRMKAFLESQRDTTNPKQAWKPALYAEIPIDTIVAKLREKYGC